jgi:protein-S-isoprenylcysteine O-methyltransferase
MVVFLIWFVSGLRVKRTVSSHSASASGGVVWIVGVGWFLLLGRGFRTGALSWRFVSPAPLVLYVGAAMAVAGLAFAVWSRWTIGANWDAFVALKDEHELVMAGPYAVVRHPIYAGFVLAAIGTALVSGEVHALVAVLLIAGAWGYKSRIEERFMSAQFGSAYDRYRARVKGWIPFVW